MLVNNFNKILNSVHPQINNRNWRYISSLIYISIFSTYLFDIKLSMQNLYTYIHKGMQRFEDWIRRQQVVRVLLLTKLSAVWCKMSDSTKKNTQNIRYPISVCRIRACGRTEFFVHHQNKVQKLNLNK